MTDPREPLGRIFHEQGRLTVNAEREKPFPGVGPWEDRTDEQRELDMRGASAVAARAVADAGVDADRMRALLFAIGVHAPAALDALAAQIANAEYESQKARFRDAEAVLLLLSGTQEET